MALPTIHSEGRDLDAPALGLVGDPLRSHPHPYTVTVTREDEFETLRAKCVQFKTAKQVPEDHVAVGLRWIDHDLSGAIRYSDPEFETWVRAALKAAGGLGKVDVTLRVIPCENPRLQALRLLRFGDDFIR
jgi:hypothetical protein